MSIEYRVYVGVFVRCQIEFVRQSEDITACPNPTCEDYKDPRIWTIDHVKFCPQCGTAFKIVQVEKKVSSIDSDDVGELLNENLQTPSGDGYLRWIERSEYHLWFPNIPTNFRDGSIDLSSSFEVTEITPASMQIEIESFQSYFLKELDMLRGQYGSDAVTIHWEIIQDYL